MSSTVIRLTARSIIRRHEPAEQVRFNSSSRSFSATKIAAAIVGGLVSIGGASAADTSSAPPSSAQTVDQDAILEPVVVTGVFIATEKLKSSAAISTVSSAEIEALQPTSSVDLLRNIPGVYVDTSQGVIQFGSGNQNTGASFISSRGLGFVQTEEDGLPLIGEGGFIQADQIPSNGALFLRADNTLDHIEAVRGGSAAITGANAPGGLFNYISKTGGDEFTANASATYGRQGDGPLPYYRGDFDVGGPIGPGGLYFNVGGFYQYDYGTHDAGYPLDYGGQLKGNILKKLDDGSVQLYFKYLNDYNAYNQPMPGADWNDPHPAPGFSNTSSTIENALTSRYVGPDGTLQSFDNRDLDHLTVTSIGLKGDYHWNSGWSISGNVKYADSRSVLNMTANGFEDTLNDFLPALFLGTTGIPGTYTYTDPKTGRTAKVGSPDGKSFTVLSNNLPTNGGVPNALFFEDALATVSATNEWQGTAAVTKSLDNLQLGKLSLGNMSFTLGTYGDASSNEMHQPDGGFGFATFTPQPQMLNVSLLTPAGQTLQLTNAAGFGGPGFGANYIYGNWSQIDAFFAHHWELDQWTLDWGIRHETARSDAYENATSPVVTTSTSNNIYSNSYSPYGPAFRKVENFNTTSYSVALNRRLSDDSAIYFRYTLGKNAPGLSAFQNEATASANPPLPETVEQYELGYSLITPRFSLDVTPYYSVLSETSVNSLVGYTNGDSGEVRIYNLLTPENKTRDTGVEFDARARFDYGFGLRTAVTWQAAKEITSYSWVQPTGVVGPSNNPSEGSTLTNTNAGNKAQNIPDVLAAIVPSYNYGPLLAQIQWQYVGAREVNNNDAWQMPAYTQTDLTLRWRFNPQLSASFFVNNLFNGGGITQWGAPGTILTGYLQSASYTAAQRIANPNAVFNIQEIAARAFFLRLDWKL